MVSNNVAIFDESRLKVESSFRKALSCLLVEPNFVCWRFEQDTDALKGGVYQWHVVVFAKMSRWDYNTQEFAVAVERLKEIFSSNKLNFKMLAAYFSAHTPDRDGVRIEFQVTADTKDN